MKDSLNEFSNRIIFIFFHIGRFTEGFKIRNIHVFIHHGDVTSVHQLPGQEAATFNCKFSTWYTGSNEKFKRFPTRMNKMDGKQGRRNHFLNWALYPDRDICVGSVLTSKGALQHLKLGQHLFDAYSKHSSLMNSKLSLTNQMKVKSTMTSRTYQSAVAFLYGFLPSFNISHIEIDHSPDLNFCTKQFSIQKSCYCKHAKTLKIRAEKFQNRFNENWLYSERLRQYITAFLHFSNFESASSFRALADALFPSFCHNISMPCSYSKSYNCQTMMGDLWNAVTAGEISKYDDPEQNFLKYNSIILTPVLVEIIHRIKDVTENRQVPRIVLYSGHDVTLSSLLLVLGLGEEKWLPYASRVVVELFEDQSDPPFSKFYLRFLYNGVDRTGDVLFCRDRTFKGLCKLNLFIEFVFTKMLKRFGFHNYYDACSR